MLRAIREIASRWVVGENVRGITTWNAGLVFEEVCADLEAQGYNVQPFVLPTAGAGARTAGKGFGLLPAVTAMDHNSPQNLGKTTIEGFRKGWRKDMSFTHCMVSSHTTYWKSKKKATQVEQPNQISGKIPFGGQYGKTINILYAGTMV